MSAKARRPIPSPGPNKALLRVEFAALNPADRYLAEGQYPAKPALPHILGRDANGTVVALGSGVNEGSLKVGDKRGSAPQRNRRQSLRDIRGVGRHPRRVARRSSSKLVARAIRRRAAGLSHGLSGAHVLGRFSAGRGFNYRRIGRRRRRVCSTGAGDAPYGHRNVAQPCEI